MKYENFMKIRPVGTELFHMGRWTDGKMTRKIVAFQNFANGPDRNGHRTSKKRSPTLVAHHIKTYGMVW
jgi:hypothetical protein